MYFKQYAFGDTAVCFAEVPVEGHEGKTTVGLAVFPKDGIAEPKKLPLDSLVQVAFAGDETLADYTLGATMRNRSSTLLKVVKQVDFISGKLNTYLTDGAGNDYTHTLSYDKATGVFTSCVRYENRTGAPRTLEHLASFSIGGICCPETKSTTGLRLHRMTSAWSRECRLKSEDFSALGLEMSWAKYGAKTEKWGQIGSMSNRGYFPFAAIEDPKTGFIWGAMLEAPYSWQLEVYEERETCSLSGGPADYETGHWRKVIPPGGSFTTENARFVVLRKGGVNAVCSAFVREQDRRLKVPESERDMPVLYNEYCASWGNPSEEKLEKQAQLASSLGCKYFVIDAGWYRPTDKGWCNAGGDWDVNPELFPSGLKHAADLIHEKGMKAGIWFEYETAGRDSKLFLEENAFLYRDGKIITAKNRRFLDLRMDSVRRYLDDRVIVQLQKCGFDYLKIDYNDNYGVGCDGAESVGEGGRQVAEESLKYLDRIKQALPDLVIENCSSGGSRIEPLRMSKVSMCSFSDAHECAEIPLVAANVSRVVPARQMQIWAVLRKKDSDSRTIYSLCAAMMGRICLSGDLPRNKEKAALVKSGLEFYESVKDVVRGGDITAIDCTVTSYRAPVGRQIYVKDYYNRRLVIVHFLEGSGTVCLPRMGFRLQASFTDLSFREEEDQLVIEGEDYHAGAFLLVRG